MNNKGYIFAELLASLVILCIIISAWLPLYSKIQVDRKDNTLRMQARHMLDKNLILSGRGDRKMSAGTFSIENKEYNFSIRAAGGFPGYQEGCLTYLNFKKKRVELCDLFKE
ncbi:hypothetical protein V1498_06960 [Peribacillus sp. SCS-26]|uniref:hypothetical protein n=1 Tax=Paraperibacillus marinus TaxID=3115295 RepID=UPI003905DD7F